MSDEEIQNRLAQLPPIELVEHVMKEWEKDCVRAHDEDERIPGPEDDPTMANLFSTKECLELIDHEIEKNGNNTEVCKTLILCAEKLLEKKIVQELLSQYEWKSFRGPSGGKEVSSEDVPDRSELTYEGVGGIMNGRGVFFYHSKSDSRYVKYTKGMKESVNRWFKLE